MATLIPPIAQPVCASLSISFATTSTCAPASVAAIAARRPAPPEPMIKISVVIRSTDFAVDMQRSLSILVPGFDRNRLQVLLSYGFCKQARLFDLGKQRDVVIDCVGPHGIIVIDLLIDMPLDNVNRQVNHILAEVGEHIGRFLLVNFVQHSRLYAVLAQERA